jgi:hypothetical protein
LMYVSLKLQLLMNWFLRRFLWLDSAYDLYNTIWLTNSYSFWFSIFAVILKSSQDHISEFCLYHHLLWGRVLPDNNM